MVSKKASTLGSEGLKHYKIGILENTSKHSISLELMGFGKCVGQKFLGTFLSRRYFGQFML